VKQIDRYLLRQFLSILGMALLGFLCIFLIVDLIENLDQFIDNRVPFAIVAQYYFYTLPWFVNIGLPMGLLIATVFSFGLIVKRNEWTAMKASGISLYRISIPLILMGFLFSYLSFEFDNYLVSWGNQNRYEIEKKYFKRSSRHRYRSIYKDVFLQKKETTHIAIGQYNINQKTARGVTILVFNQGLLSQRIDAKSMTYIDSLQAWATSNYSIRKFDATGQEIEAKISSRDSLLQIEFSPDDITKQSKSPDELNYQELTERIQQLRENGVDTTRWEVVRYFKISFAFTNLIVVLFGIPIVVMRPKGGLTFGAGMSFLVIFAYYAFIKFGQSLGFKEILEPFTAAWIGNVIFMFGGIMLLFFARK